MKRGGIPMPTDFEQEQTKAKTARDKAEAEKLAAEMEKLKAEAESFRRPFKSNPAAWIAIFVALGTIVTAITQYKISNLKADRKLFKIEKSLDKKKDEIKIKNEELKQTREDLSRERAVLSKLKEDTQRERKLFVEYQAKTQQQADLLADLGKSVESRGATAEEEKILRLGERREEPTLRISPIVFPTGQAQRSRLSWETLKLIAGIHYIMGSAERSLLSESNLISI
jgi:hypothetical protein